MLPLSVILIPPVHLFTFLINPGGDYIIHELVLSRAQCEQHAARWEHLYTVAYAHPPTEWLWSCQPTPHLPIIPLVLADIPANPNALPISSSSGSPSHITPGVIPLTPH